VTLRRTPEAVLAVLAMDPSRREVYVEGPSDRAFVAWITNDCRNDEVVIQDAEAVEIESPGGAKGRLLALARVIGHHDRLRIFVDRDEGMSVPVPTGVITSDGRDCEAYVLNAECLDKAVSLGISTSAISGAALHRMVMDCSRQIAVLREVSRESGMDLPFQSTPVSRSVTSTRDRVTLDLPSLVRRLASQSVGIREANRILALHAEMVDRTRAIPDNTLVHGKDAFAIIAELFRRYGVERDDVPRILRVTFERSMVDAHANLSELVSFICP
jgi:hypothetical protein